MKLNRHILFHLLFLFFLTSEAQQIPDTTYSFPISQCAYEENEGPLVLIDEAHNNLHTGSGGFLPFKKLLKNDGYNVKEINEKFTNPQVLAEAEILVIANALHASNIGNWTLPTPSAFTQKEIKVIKGWVKNGGKLFLIADHMPYAGAAKELGEAFGFGFINGFAHTKNNTWPPSIFSKDNGGLMDTYVTNGNNEHENIQRVATFTGSAFKIPNKAISVIQFSDEHFSLQPDTAWNFDENTPSIRLDEYHQGALLEYGKGKVAIFGEAAMFTAQIANETIKAGFNSEYAPDNAQFTLNIIHWLDGIKEYNCMYESNSQTSTKERAFLELNRKMEEAYLANDLLKVASFYSDDGVMVGNKHEVKGKTAIENYWVALKDRGISWELENIQIEVYESVAIQRGISRMKFKHNNEPHLSEVRFTLVWKEIKGEWKIAIDHYSLL